MLAKLNNELLSIGPSAVLPQNLSDSWLAVLQERAEVYLDATYDLEVCREPSDDADPMLIACVVEIFRRGSRRAAPIEPDKLGELLTLYSLSLIIESAVRHHGLAAPRPEVKDFFSWDRIVTLANEIPELSQFLKQACMMKSSKAGWFDALKTKLRTGLRTSSRSEANG